jgi:hypothetical protein
LLVLKALEGQHHIETCRLEEMALYGPNRDSLCDEVRALGDLVMTVKLTVLRQGGHTVADPLACHCGTGVHVRRPRSRLARRGSRPQR